MPDDRAISVLEMIDDECRDLSGSTEPLDPEREEYTRLLSTGTAGQTALESAERAFRRKVVARLHRAKRSALCFSGGGIRSATFGLGVLQGLAKASARQQGRPALLGEFDYLSTVSGGGYLGGWFSAWAAQVEQQAEAGMIDGPAEVMRTLADRQDSTFEPEPPIVHHLRSYTSYLSPRLGFLSGDTWMLVATVARNMFLNWLVLLPILAAVVLVPVFAWRLMWLKPVDITSGPLWFMLAGGLFCGAVATAYIGYDLPSAGNARNRRRGYLIFCLAPLILAAIQLNTFWGWLPQAGCGRLWDLVCLGKSGLQWWHFAGFGALMHGGGMLAGLGFARIRFNRPPTRIGLIASAAAVLTGGVAGVAAWLLTSLPKIDAAGTLLNPKLYVLSAFPLLMLLFMLAATLLVGATSYVTEDQDREWWSRSGGWLLLIALAWPVACALVLYAAHAVAWVKPQLSGTFASITGLMGWSASRLGSSAKTSAGRRENGNQESDSEPKHALNIRDFSARLILPGFLGLLVVLFSALNEGFLHAIQTSLLTRIPSFWPSFLRPMGDITAPVIWLAIFYAGLCGIASYFINVNKFSLHAMYRQRLIRAYLGASNAHRDPHPFTGFDEADNISMSMLSRRKPMHVVNMALNLVGGQNLAWQQRKAASFTCTRTYTGSCRVGYRPSASYGGAYKSGKQPISLGTAMTISGAAASPNMGYNSSALLTLVMTLFNARLGWWLGNPRGQADEWRKPGPSWGIRPFIDEALGRTSDSNAWVYLSDGGHFDNLGLYEMALRRCHLIVVSDSSADPRFAYDDLANAVRKIRIDLGIPIEMEQDRMPAPLRHCGTARILYSAVDGPDAEDGLLIYLKPCLTGDESPDVANYASRDKTFPHQTTADQFFDEAQFESYRRLGLHTIEVLCGPRSLTLEQFVQAARIHAGVSDASAAGV